MSISWDLIKLLLEHGFYLTNIASLPVFYYYGELACKGM